eukprot:TRINITY_DN66248_c0_g1_i1.p1 TRINITY_DN66248_c0_g1~~TRINITY_DN66248_c0_g1_i1.p1  ORF type:complete len:232 (-),score=43.50 TRINITY_DN66248_c0_g1_i1:219-914(-)
MVQAARPMVPKSRKTKRSPSYGKKSYPKRARKEPPANQKFIAESKNMDQVLEVRSKNTAVDEILGDVRAAERKHLGLRPGTLCHVYKEAIIALQEVLGSAYLSWRCYRSMRIKEFRLHCDFMELSNAVACHEALREDGIRVDELSSQIPPIDLAKEALVMTALSKSPHSSTLPEHEQMLLPLQLPAYAASSQSMIDTLPLPLQLAEDVQPLELPRDAVPLQLLQDPMALPM